MNTQMYMLVQLNNYFFFLADKKNYVYLHLRKWNNQLEVYY